MDSTMFATISVKYTRRIALLAGEKVPENQNKIKEGESEAKRKRKTFLIWLEAFKWFFSYADFVYVRISIYLQYQMHKMLHRHLASWNK